MRAFDHRLALWFSSSTFAEAWDPNKLTLLQGMRSSIWLTLWAFLGMELAAQNSEAFDIDARIVPVDSYDAGIQRLINGTSDVLFGDKAILLEAAKRNPEALNLTLLDRRFTSEPIALVLARGDEDFRLIVDQKLSQTIRSDAFHGLYARWFGAFDQSSARFFSVTVLPD